MINEITVYMICGTVVYCLVVLRTSIWQHVFSISHPSMKNCRLETQLPPVHIDTTVIYQDQTSQAGINPLRFGDDSVTYCHRFEAWNSWCLESLRLDAFFTHTIANVCSFTGQKDRLSRNATTKMVAKKLLRSLSASPDQLKASSSSLSSLVYELSTGC